MSICNRNRIMTGVRFLFRVTLRRLEHAAEIYHLREPEKLPLVMSVDEIKRLLAVAGTLKTRVLLTSAMAAGCGRARSCGSRSSISTAHRTSLASSSRRAARTAM